jgi:hypothetical protein
MADRFSGQVGRVIDLARDEAERLGHRGDQPVTGPG